MLRFLPSKMGHLVDFPCSSTLITIWPPDATGGSQAAPRHHHHSRCRARTIGRLDARALALRAADNGARETKRACGLGLPGLAVLHQPHRFRPARPRTCRSAQCGAVPFRVAAGDRLIAPALPGAFPSFDHSSHEISHYNFGRGHVPCRSRFGSRGKCRARTCSSSSTLMWLAGRNSVRGQGEFGEERGVK
jgi:hypothetical protein